MQQLLLLRTDMGLWRDNLREGQVFFIEQRYTKDKYFGVFLDKMCWLVNLDGDLPEDKRFGCEFDLGVNADNSGVFSLYNRQGWFDNLDLNEACHYLEDRLGILLKEGLGKLKKDSKGDFFLDIKSPNVNKEKRKVIESRKYPKAKVMIQYTDGSSYRLNKCTSVEVNSSVKYKFFIIVDFSTKYKYSFTSDEVEYLVVKSEGKTKILDGSSSFIFNAKKPHNRWI